jgi:hypothetical protein
LTEGITGFYAQFGYYSYKALFPFGPFICDAANAGHPVHIVLGSNKGSLNEVDLRWTFDLIKDASNASLSVVVFGNAEFHPKVACIRAEDGNSSAVVGSANLTLSGLGRNVEAFVALESSVDGDDIFQQITNSICSWNQGGDGVFQVSDLQDIEDLKTAKLINVPRPPTARPGRASGSVPDVRNPGTRKSLWSPSSKPAQPTDPEPPVISSDLNTNQVALPPDHGAILWRKALAASDCESQSGHGTGGIRLTQAGFSGIDGEIIDQTTYFRELFDDFDWHQTRVSPYVENAIVPFRLVARGVDFGIRQMEITHKPTGEAGQGNYTTLLKWSGITAEIKALSLTGYTFTLYGPAPISREPFFIEIT